MAMRSCSFVCLLLGAAGFVQAEDFCKRFDLKARWPHPREDLPLSSPSWAPRMSSQITWRERHNADVRSLEQCGPEKKLETLVLGDSITEHWTRPFFSEAGRRLKFTEEEEVPAQFSFKSVFGRNSASAAIHGDRVPDMGWRLQHGLSRGIKKCQPKRVLFAIGTNDLFSGNRIIRTPQQLVDDYRHLMCQVLKDLEDSGAPEPELVVEYLMPRATSSQKVPSQSIAFRQCPFPEVMTTGDCTDEFVKTMQANRLLTHLGTEFRRSGHKVRIVNCNDYLLQDGMIRKDIQPDLLHLSHKGYMQWAKCLRNVGIGKNRGFLQVKLNQTLGNGM